MKVAALMIGLATMLALTMAQHNGRMFDKVNAYAPSWLPFKSGPPSVKWAASIIFNPQLSIACFAFCVSKHSRTRLLRLVWECLEVSEHSCTSLSSPLGPTSVIRTDCTLLTLPLLKIGHGILFPNVKQSKMVNTGSNPVKLDIKQDL